MPDGWCEWAIPCPGPESKTGYKNAAGQWVDRTHTKVGIVTHCAEYESTPEWDDYKTLHNALFSDREASWTFSICKFMNGSILYQHYPLDAVTWHAGYQGNLWLVGIETEGIAPGKFTEAQYALLVKTLRWIKEAHQWKLAWRIGDRQFISAALDSFLFEHANTPGAPATDCAVFSRGQVDPDRLLRDLKEEDMDEQQIREIVRDEVGKQTNWLRGFCQALSNVMRPLGFWPFSEEEKSDKLRENLEIDAWDNLDVSEMKWRGY